MRIKFNGKTPIYLQVTDIIKMDIVTGKLKAMQELPSVQEMAIILMLNPNTIQRAYEELERLRIIYIQKGIGTFVRDERNIVDDLKNEMASKAIHSFIPKMKKLGFTDNEILKSYKEVQY